METEFLSAAIDTMRTTTALVASAASVLFFLKWILFLILLVIGFLILRRISKMILPFLRTVAILILELIEKIRRKFLH